MKSSSGHGVYGQEMSLVVFSIDDFESVEPASQKDILTVFSLVSKTALRDIDLYFHDQEASRFFLVLPNTPPGGRKDCQPQNFRRDPGL